jgi:hypothetical protein
MLVVVGPVGTVKKPSVFCEALFKLLWESALFADFHQQRQFPQALFSFFFATFFFLRTSPQFSTEKNRARIAQQRRSPTRSTHGIPCFGSPQALFTFPK